MMKIILAILAATLCGTVLLMQAPKIIGNLAAETKKAYDKGLENNGTE